MIVNVTKKIRSTRLAFAREYKRAKMISFFHAYMLSQMRSRYFNFAHTVETTTGLPIVNVSFDIR